MELVDRESGEYHSQPKADEQQTDATNLSLSNPSRPEGFKTMEGERELTTGLLSKTASFRLIVSGEVGVKEIDRLIAKLQLDKEILADPDGNNDK
jgi:hypothetical protein